MTDFTVTIIGAPKLNGITAAREAYNDWGEGTPTFINTDEEYVQFVMDKAAESYANQYGTWFPPP